MKYKILFVSAEVAPYAKTGGLADVAGSLPQALIKMGHDVKVVMPRYKSIHSEMKYVTDFSVEMDNRKETCILREISDSNITTYFIDSYQYFDRLGMYCHFDDGDRFAFFCKAVLEMLPKISFKPDIIHCNDWHTGPICMMLKEKYDLQPFYKGIKTIFTIHNLEYQGHFSKHIVRLLDIPESVFVPEKVEFYGQFNFLKAGVVYADKVNTVSVTYADEIKTAEFGERLDGLMRERDKDLSGIVNGISYEHWNPQTDEAIYKNYSSKNIKDKYINKYELQNELNLKKSEAMMISVVHRLTSQKGLELVLKSFDKIMDQGVQFVLLGEGDPYLENEFKNMMKKYPEQVAVRIEFNAELAQKIYASGDVFLMPSTFEPCGLGQMISLRYGTIPIVRATGGLAETVIDSDEDSENGTGFVFSEYSEEAFYSTLTRAIEAYGNKRKWNKIVRNAMQADFSWDTSAQKYVSLYQEI